MSNSSNAYSYLEQMTKKNFVLKECTCFDNTSNVWILDEHKHDFIELIYFIYGEAQVVTSNGEKNLTLYDVLLHPAGELHREIIDLHKRQEIINIFLDGEVGVGLNESIVLKDNTGYMKTLFQAISYHADKQDKMSETIIDKLLELLFLYMFKSIQDNSISDYDIVEKTIRYVQDNYMNHLSVAEIASVSHISPSYLSRVMKKQMGMSPMKYVNTIRIEVSKRLLKERIPIDKISTLVGIEDPKYFSKVFKSFTGISPSDYRRNNRSVQK